MMKRQTLSFKHAFHGLIYSLKTQPNYRVHLFLSLGAILLSVLLHISRIEFIVILLLIATGLTIETINTAVEQAADAVDINIREDIRIIKDVSAAAMLIFAIGAIIIAAMIFVPRL